MKIREVAARRTYPEFRARILKAWDDHNTGKNPNTGDPLTLDKLGHYLASREPNAMRTLHAVKLDADMELNEWTLFAAWANGLLETALLDDELEAVEA